MRRESGNNRAATTERRVWEGDSNVLSDLRHAIRRTHILVLAVLFESRELCENLLDRLPRQLDIHLQSPEREKNNQYISLHIRELPRSL